jgi:hypothetical protein
MLPLLAAGIGAAGSIASGFMGANAANRAADDNWQINLLNYYQREREREDRMAESRINKREQKQGYTDADGGSTKWVPGQGWVTTRGKEMEELDNLQKQEQRNVLTRDLPMRRRSMDRNEARSLEDEAQADTLRRDMRDVRREDDSVLESLLYDAATRKMAQAYDESQATAVREAQRTGSSNIPKILEGMNKNRAESYGDAAMEAKLRSRGQGDAEFERKRAGLANLYNMFATRASVGPDVSYRPQNVEGAAGGMADNLSKQMLAAGKDLADAAGQRGGTMDYVQPNYGMANAIGGGANALAGMFRGIAAGGGGNAAQKYDNRLRD